MPRLSTPTPFNTFLSYRIETQSVLRAGGPASATSEFTVHKNPQKGVEKMKTTDKVLWNDIYIGKSNWHTLGDNRSRISVYFRDYRGKPIFHRKFTFSVKDARETAKKKLDAMIELCAIECADKIISHFVNMKDPAISLEAYAILRWESIKRLAKWAGKAEEYRETWDMGEMDSFKKLNLLECADKKVLIDKMEEITHRKKRKEAMGEKEAEWWIILGGILAYAVFEGIIFTESGRSPIAEVVKKASKSQSEIASKNMARRSECWEEQELFCEVCCQRIDSSDVFVAMLMSMLNGMTVAEVCGCNLGALKNEDEVYWIEVRQAYRQTRGKPPCTTLLLESVHAYRKLPCTSVVRELWMYQKRRQKQRGLCKTTDPLFLGVDGERLTPDELKKAITDILNEIVCEGAKLRSAKRGNLLRGENKPTLSHGEFLRGTAEFCFRNLCGFSNEEIDVLLGRKSSAVWANNYCDWGNDLVLLHQNETIQKQWHGKISALNPNGAKDLCNGSAFAGRVLAGSVVRIQSLHGVAVVVKRRETGK